MKNPNAVQVEGTHYKTGGLEHWDMCFIVSWNYLLSAAWKYVDRLGKKGDGVVQLQKAIHYLYKYQQLTADGLDGEVQTCKLDHVQRAEEPEVRALFNWAVGRGYSVLQMSFVMRLAWGDIETCISILQTELKKQSSLPTQDGGPGRTYINPDLLKP